MAKKDSLTQLRAEFTAHTKADAAALAAIQKTLASIEKKLDSNPENPEYILRQMERTLKPISETYDTASHLGKWAMTGLVVVSLFLGIVWAIIQIGASKISVSL